MVIPFPRHQMRVIEKDRICDVSVGTIENGYSVIVKNGILIDTGIDTRLQDASVEFTSEQEAKDIYRYVISLLEARVPRLEAVNEILGKEWNEEERQSNQ